MSAPFYVLSSSGDESTDGSTTNTTLSGSSHDTSRARYHIRDVEEFASDLDNAAKSAFPNHGRSRYETVNACLIRWEEDELSVEPELKRLSNKFQDYGFATQEWQIPSRNSNLDLMMKTGQFIRDSDNNKNLFILYYGGHGRINAERQAEWVCKAGSKSAIVQWSAIQTLFADAESDVLILLDACAAASATARSRHGSMEAIMACGFGSRDIAPPPGEHSFTNALIDVLDDWIGRTSFSASCLHAEILSQLKLKEKKKGREGIRLEWCTTPIHINCNIDSKAPSIELCRRNVQPRPTAASLTPPSFPHVDAMDFDVEGSASSSLSSLSSAGPSGEFLVPHVIISVALEENQPDLDTKRTARWLEGIPLLVKWAKVEAVFQSYSTLLLLSVPIPIWNMLPDNPACSFVGYVTSPNLVSRPPFSGAESAVTPAVNESLAAAIEIIEHPPYNAPSTPLSLAESHTVSQKKSKHATSYPSALQRSEKIPSTSDETGAGQPSIPAVVTANNPPDVPSEKEHNEILLEHLRANSTSSSLSSRTPQGSSRNSIRSIRSEESSRSTMPPRPTRIKSASRRSGSRQASQTGPQGVPETRITESESIKQRATSKAATTSANQRPRSRESFPQSFAHVHYTEQSFGQRHSNERKSGESSRPRPLNSVSLFPIRSSQMDVPTAMLNSASYGSSINNRSINMPMYIGRMEERIAAQSTNSISHQSPIKPSSRVQWPLEDALEWKRERKTGSHKPPPFSGLNAFLRTRDHTFLIDDSESMAPHWQKVTEVLGILSYILKDADPDGLNLDFTISPIRSRKVKTSSEMIRMVEQRQNDLTGTTDMRLSLSRILGRYLAKVEKPKSLFKKSARPLNIYIFTNGVWKPGCSVKDAIKKTAQELDSLGRPRTQVGIQFIAFGSDSEGLKRLNELDTNLGLDIPDFVDTEPGDGNVYKMILGSYTEMDGMAKQPEVRNFDDSTTAVNDNDSQTENTVHGH